MFSKQMTCWYDCLIKQWLIESAPPTKLGKAMRKTEVMYFIDRIDIGYLQTLCNIFHVK